MRPIQLREHNLFDYEDEYIKNRVEGHTRWIAEIDNSYYIYQDDGRVEEPTWLRLQNFCKATDSKVTGLTLQFRSNSVSLPKNKSGYYFVNGAMFQLGGKKTYQYMLIGYVEDGVVKITKYKVPELVSHGTEERTIEECQNLII